MRFILKVDKEDCFKVAELKEITAVELLIINKALHLLSQNEEVAESDRYVAEKLGAELMRMDAVQRPLTAIDGAEVADTPQTDCEDVWRVGYKTGYDKGFRDAQKVNDSQELVKDLIKAFCEDGTWLERQGVYTLTLAEAKQRAIDIIESVLAKTEPQTDCGWK